MTASTVRHGNRINVRQDRRRPDDPPDLPPMAIILGAGHPALTARSPAPLFCFPLRQAHPAFAYTAASGGALFWSVTDDDTK